MSNIHNLIIYHEAIELVSEIGKLGKQQAFGDLITQIRRAAISVASNIAEGAAIGNDRSFRKHLTIARGSVNVVQAQLEIMAALGSLSSKDHRIDLATRIGKRISCFIKAIDTRTG